MRASLTARAFERRLGGASRRGLRGGSRRRAIYGLYDWDTSTVFGTAVNGGVQGSAATGLSVLVLARLDALPGALNRLTEAVNGNNGWGIRSNNVTLQMNVGNNTTSVFGPTRTWVAGDVGKLHVFGLSHDLTTVHTLFNGAEVGTGTALAGYSVPTGEAQVVGSTDTGLNPALSFTILGVCGRNSPLSVANFATICAATKAAGELALGGISMDHHWTVPRNGSVPSTIADKAGSSNMSFLSGSAANLLARKISRPGTWGF